MLKRLLDLVIAVPVIIVASPFWLLIAIIIKLESPGPALYLHTRVGKNAKEFLCFKFRSMRTGSNPNMLADSVADDRITKFGKFLRKTSLDETPQLLNVLNGDMSIVGPRPALPIQVQNFSEIEKLKLTVKPGLTGWTQVNGRNSIPYEKRMELDVWYAQNHNLFLDLKIIFKTFGVLIWGDGIYDKNSSSPH
ncbi:MAG: sugar transferase [Candidatus Caenarcaniphilales bacterium]|nr:sugar transferase [Candidatus Caenarcaniphilales bacterium]